ncbi:L-threonylcarbamoyladenylate synthase [Melioribacteraceae bacterium 4301-Me]|uniref:L-threonylcarbamoyladenylate synthase n=1 Tax=Pyranulibacter aquaticus TaxID=3163344 RepID=UPI0035968399
MNIVNATKTNISLAAKIIKSGGLVAFPTETVYGLGADGLNPIAVAKIFEVKKRPQFNPLILHISDLKMLYKITNYNSKLIDRLIKEFWPGPLTLVLPKKDIVPNIVTAGNPTVAIRMPDHKVALELIKKSGVPIAAPSANVFSKLSPTTAQHVENQLGEKVNLILDGGKCRVGVESTIIKIDNKGVELLRPGGIPIEEIEIYTGKLKRRTTSNKPAAPGQLPYHYAPSIPIAFLSRNSIFKNKKKKVGAIFFSEKKINYEFASVKILSEKKDLREAAANLFQYLHELENQKLDIILVEKVQEKGLGLAIMDRLKKAIRKYK